MPLVEFETLDIQQEFPAVDMETEKSIKRKIVEFCGYTQLETHNPNVLVYKRKGQLSKHLNDFDFRYDMNELDEVINFIEHHYGFESYILYNPEWMGCHKVVFRYPLTEQDQEISGFKTLTVVAKDTDKKEAMYQAVCSFINMIEEQREAFEEYYPQFYRLNPYKLKSKIA